MNYGLRKTDIQYIIEALQSFNDIDQAILFGSRAMGNYKQGSDVDMAIKGKELADTTIYRLSDLLNEELPLPYFFDIIVYDRINNKELKKHIDKFGKVIY